MADKFRVGITNDFLTSDGESAFGDIGLDVFDSKPGLGYEFLMNTTPRQLQNSLLMSMLSSHSTPSSTKTICVTPNV